MTKGNGISMSAKNFSSLAAVTLSSGIMICDLLSEVQELADHVTGEPTWTHQFASRPFMDALEAEVVRQHPELRDVTIQLDGLDDLSGDAQNALIECERDRLRKILGDKMAFVTGKVDQGDSFTEPLGRIGSER